ncbi:hypothetical protein GX51_05891 [Blastomyces parvus]|uniref:Uncharacterized protein n=1 Tax=Blastomyces parvus TaxID=2060905 RepID=A0A2B7WUR3_9EURO|nr:hypothetical protein GX51_05891 [Blastomyces parvus]
MKPRYNPPDIILLPLKLGRCGVHIGEQLADASAWKRQAHPKGSSEMAVGAALSLERTSVLAPDTANAQSRDQRTRRVQPKVYSQRSFIIHSITTTPSISGGNTSTTYPQHE